MLKPKTIFILLFIALSVSVLVFLSTQREPKPQPIMVATTTLSQRILEEKTPVSTDSPEDVIPYQEPLNIPVPEPPQPDIQVPSTSQTAPSLPPKEKPQPQDYILQSTIKYPQYGEQWATLSIPRIGLNQPVYHGDYEQQLSKGIGHYDGSKFPGEGGNIVLAGHRETVFGKLGQIQKGDTLTLTTTYGTYIYQASSTEIVDENSSGPTQSSSYEKLTLYTCYPFDRAPGYHPQRYVIYARLIDGASITKG